MAGGGFVDDSRVGYGRSRHFALEKLCGQKEFERGGFCAGHDHKKKFDKIAAMIEDIHRNGAMRGIGKPERLKHRAAFSRRIDHENRLVYDFHDGGNLHI